MRRLRVVPRTHTSGRLGSPSGPTTWLRRSRLHGMRMKAAKAGRIRLAVPSGSTVPSPKIAAMERREAMRFRKHHRFARDAGSETLPDAPYGAPCPSYSKGHNDKISSRDARERMRVDARNFKGAV